MITAEFIINAFLTSIQYEVAVNKNHGKKINSYALFKAFNDSIRSLYQYIDYNTNSEIPYSFDIFKNLFYDAVCYDEELPEDVQGKFIIYINRTKEVEKNFVYSILDEIKTCIMKLKLDRAIEDFWIKDNDRKTKKVRELVFGYSHKCNSYALIRPLITWAKNHNRLNDEFIYKIFEYGYITGKRAERTKRKTA